MKWLVLFTLLFPQAELIASTKKLVKAKKSANIYLKKLREAEKQREQLPEVIGEVVGKKAASLCWDKRIDLVSGYLLEEDVSKRLILQSLADTCLRQALEKKNTPKSDKRLAIEQEIEKLKTQVTKYFGKYRKEVFRYFKKRQRGKGRFLIPCKEFTRANILGQKMLLEVPREAEVISPGEGVISYVGNLFEAGSVIIIRHPNDLYTVIEGDFKISARANQIVKKKSVLAKVAEDDAKLSFHFRRKEKKLSPIEMINFRELI